MRRDGPMKLALAGLAVLLVWSSLWLLGRLWGDRSGTDQPSAPPPAGQSGRAPLVTASSFLCPPEWPYSAYKAGDNRYFPPNHPLIPARRVRPDRCYSTPIEAEVAGYTPAPPPPGGLDVDGVYLVVVDLEQECLRAATRLGHRVPCPTRLPNPGFGSKAARCGDRSSFGRYTRPPCVFGRTFLLDQAGFAIPPGYGSGALDGSHLVITSQRGEDPGVPPRILACRDSKVIGSIIVRPLNANRYLPALILVCPDGALSLDEYLILGWTESSVVHHVALSGDIPTNRRVLEAIAANIQMVDPQP